jgi:hypothetical protein
MRLGLSLVLVVALGACASPPPLACTAAIDRTGHGIPVCNGANQVPVCDLAGMHAHYEMNAAGTYDLVGGEMAVCDSSNQVACPDRTESPYCLVRPVAN